MSDIILPARNPLIDSIELVDASRVSMINELSAEVGGGVLGLLQKLLDGKGFPGSVSEYSFAYKHGLDDEGGYLHQWRSASVVSVLDGLNFSALRNPADARLAMDAKMLALYSLGGRVEYGLLTEVIKKEPLRIPERLMYPNWLGIKIVVAEDKKDVCVELPNYELLRSLV